MNADINSLIAQQVVIELQLRQLNHRLKALEARLEEVNLETRVDNLLKELKRIKYAIE